MPHKDVYKIYGWMCYTRPMSTVYIVATPIGNLEDMTHRAVRTLQEVDIIYCEDTRTSRKLLDHYDITTRTESYHAHSSDARHESIIEHIRQGTTIALISDAGTPTISDPGVKLVAAIRKQLPDVRISPIPGASALMSALCVSGISSAHFTFLGFLPHKKGRQSIFEKVRDMDHTAVFYESPHRLMKTLASLRDTLPQERTVVIARELTKIYEEVVQGSAEYVYDHFDKNPESVRGEFVIMVSS